MGEAGGRGVCDRHPVRIDPVARDSDVIARELPVERNRRGADRARIQSSRMPGACVSPLHAFVRGEIPTRAELLPAVSTAATLSAYVTPQLRPPYVYDMLVVVSTSTPLRNTR